MDLLTDASRKVWSAEHERGKRIAVANDLKDLAADENVWAVVTYQATIENRDWLNDEKNVLTEYKLFGSEGTGKAVYTPYQPESIRSGTTGKPDAVTYR